jgi:predicted PurR-regulated permease PerM
MRGYAVNDQSPEGQAEKWADREEAHARQVVTTAKVVVTFWGGIAATFVATAIQTAGNKCLDRTAAILMLLAVVVTAVVVAVPSRPKAGGHKFKDAQERTQAAEAAAKRAEDLHWLMVIQVVLSGLAGILAAIGLLTAGG